MVKLDPAVANLTFSPVFTKANDLVPDDYPVYYPLPQL